MAVSIEELIQNKSKIEEEKKALYDLTTSIGVITVKPANDALLAECLERDKQEADKYMVYNSVVSPNLKDSKLLKAYECMEPFDIVDKLFKPGEVHALSTKIISLAGYNQEIEATLHKTAKN